MRYIVEIEQIVSVPIVIDAHSEREARAMATQALQSTIETEPEAVRDPVAEPPCIRRVRRLGR